MVFTRSLIFLACIPTEILQLQTSEKMLLGVLVPPAMNKSWILTNIKRHSVKIFLMPC